MGTQQSPTKLTPELQASIEESKFRAKNRLVHTKQAQRVKIYRGDLLPSKRPPQAPSRGLFTDKDVWTKPLLTTSRSCHESLSDNKTKLLTLRYLSKSLTLNSLGCVIDHDDDEFHEDSVQPVGYKPREYSQHGSDVVIESSSEDSE